MKKMSDNTKQGLTIAGIILCVAVCAVCFFSDAKDAFSGFSDSALEEIAEGAKEVGEAAGSAIQPIVDNLDGAFASEIEAGLESAEGIEKCTVLRVVDGDTYSLDIGGEETRVRLIGVDTPESVAPASYAKGNTEEGKTVSDIVKDKIKAGDVLYAEYDVSKTDKYGRTLAYLYFEDGKMVQEWLLENGYAQVMTIQPNSKYADRFVEIQHKAAESKTGLWNGFFE